MTQCNIVIKSLTHAKDLREITLTLKVDNLKKMTNASKRNMTNASNEKEKFKDIFRKCVWKQRSKSFFLCGVLSFNSSATFKKSFVGQ